MNLKIAAAIITLSWHLESINGFTTSMFLKELSPSSFPSSLFGKNPAVDSFDAVHVEDPVELIGREKLKQYFDFEVDSCKFFRKLINTRTCMA